MTNPGHLVCRILFSYLGDVAVTVMENLLLSLLLYGYVGYVLLYGTLAGSVSGALAATIIIIEDPSRNRVCLLTSSESAIGWTR